MDRVNEFWEGLSEDISNAARSSRPYFDIVHEVVGRRVRLKEGGAGDSTSELYDKLSSTRLDPGDVVLVQTMTDGTRVVMGRINDYNLVIENGGVDVVFDPLLINAGKGLVASLSGTDSRRANIEADWGAGTDQIPRGDHYHLLPAVVESMERRNGDASTTFNSTAGSTILTVSYTLPESSNWHIFAFGGGQVAAPSTSNTVYLRANIGPVVGGAVGTRITAPGGWVSCSTYRFIAGSGTTTATLLGLSQAAGTSTVYGAYLQVIAIPTKSGAPL